VRNRGKRPGPPAQSECKYEHSPDPSRRSRVPRAALQPCPAPRVTRCVDTARRAAIALHASERGKRNGGEEENERGRDRGGVYSRYMGRGNSREGGGGGVRREKEM
jgi:hypothetical protein